MKTTYYIFVFICFFPLCTLAQKINITGKVTAQSNGSPLSGISVTLQGSKGKISATVTNASGEYTLKNTDDATELVFSFVGMQSVTEKLNGRSRIDTRLSEENSDLQEVVVVGYATQKKESLTGAISNITNSAIQTTTHVSLAQKLQGKVAGLQIRQNSGQPGDFDNSINIRGFGDPLYVIDGIAREGGNEFQKLNPEDIESISILKDASAAIYGLRAANGVILVTTKKGSKGSTSFNYNVVVGSSSPTNMPRMANAGEYVQILNDANLFKVNGTPAYTKEELQKWINGGPGYQSTDWYDATMKKSSMQQQHNISASGGSDKTSYYVSFGYLQDDGLLRSNDMGYQKYTFRSNLSTQLTKNLKADILIAGRYDTKTQPGENFFNIFKGTRTTLPIESPYANNNPLYPATVLSTQNPVALANSDLTGYSKDYTRNFQSSVSLTYDVPFVKGLSVKGTAAYDANNYQNKSLALPYDLYSYSAADTAYNAVHQRVGSANISNYNSNNNNLTLQGYVNYSTTIAGKHHISAVAVVEEQQWNSRFSSIKRYYDKFYTKDQIRFAGTQNQESDGLEDQTASLSYIGRFNYDYLGKYLLEFAFRENGSYAYSPDKRWGFFPVVSAGWRISEEKFIKNTALSFISNLKIRGSYGLVGNDLGRPYQYVPGFTIGSGGSYEFVDGTQTIGVKSPAIVNANLSWMRSKQLNLGVDLGLFNNRLTFIGDIYQRLMEGIPAARNVSIPNTFGGILPEENLNSNRTRGIELTLGYTGQFNDFHYGVSGNFSYSRTMNRHVENGGFLNSADKYRNDPENRWNDILWGYVYEGQFQNTDELRYAPMQNGNTGNINKELPGDFKYKDMNNDGVINDQDMVPLFHGTTPNINYGLSLNASWKGFDMNVLLQGQGQYTVRYSEVYGEVMAFKGNTPAYFFDRWHKADPYDPNSEWIPGKWPASRFNTDIGMEYAESSVWRREGTYVRLKSVELGYTLNPEWYSRIGVKKVRVYASGFNLLTITDPFLKAFDPEKVSGKDGSSAGYTYPVTKTFNIGVNVSF